MTVRVHAIFDEVPGRMAFPSEDGSTDMTPAERAQIELARATVPTAFTVVDLTPATGQPARLTRRPTRHQPSAVLRVQRGPGVGRVFPVAGDAITTVGRHPDNAVLLSSVTVSRWHAQIRPEGGQLVVVDLGSLSGTYLNRRPVDSAILADGDELTIGAYRLVFHT